MRVNLSSYPSLSKLYSVNFPKLSGGLNLKELDYRLGPDESPEMKNLWWQDGVLQCRDGQVYVSPDELGTGYACTQQPYYDTMFFHIDDSIYFMSLAGENPTLQRLRGDVPKNRGTFFRYQDYLFYKNKGAFIRIRHQLWSNGSRNFYAHDVVNLAYTPVVLINTSPVNGSGAMYQPENRLSAKKTIWYNAVEGVTVYKLPVTDIDTIVSVVVDGATLAGDDYTVDYVSGTVTFKTAPPVTTPATNNSVKITYSKPNPDALDAIMDCEYAFVGGGDTNLCILLGGCDAQPNAVFWNSNDNVSMNPTYWPMSYYNLVGGTEDPVMGFGKQYSTLVVFKRSSLGKLSYGVEKVDDRDSISFTYSDINSRVGCNLPDSIQLIENNLVWANTDQGVHMLRSTSAAFENNVDCISDKINGGQKGLLKDLRSAPTVASFDDDSRYWLCCNGVAYVWDYALSTYSDPSWFYFTNIGGVAFFRDDTRRLYHLDGSGRVTRFERVFSDYDEGIEKVYRFPTQHFGSYERLKDIPQLLVSVRSDTDTDIAVKYDTDYETRYDHTPIRTYSWRLAPRNLAHRCLDVPKYAYVAKRKPGCRHVRHFALTLSNSAKGEDLSIVSMQIFYRFQGRER